MGISTKGGYLHCKQKENHHIKWEMKTMLTPSTCQRFLKRETYVCTNPKRQKTGSKAEKGIFIGYAKDVKGRRVYFLSKNKLI